MMKYDFNEEDLAKLRQGIQFDIAQKTESAVPQDVANSTVFQWVDDSGCLVTATLTYTTPSPCSGDQQHSYGEPCPLAGGSGAATGGSLVISYSYAFCSNGTQIGGPSTPIDVGPGPNTGGAGTSGTTGTTVTPTQNNNEEEDEVVTTPVEPGLVGNDGEQEKTPCSELNKFIVNNAIQGTLRILKGQSSGQVEHGNYMSETTNSVGATYISYPVIPQDPNDPTKLNIAAGLATGKVKGAMHCHTDPVTTRMFPMFSADDLNNLYQIAYEHVPTNNVAKIYTEYTVMLSVGSGHYALKLKNFSGDYNAKFNANFVDFKKKLESDNEKVGPNSTSNLLVKIFLENIDKSFGNEIGLYKLPRQRVQTIYL